MEIRPSVAQVEALRRAAAHPLGLYTQSGALGGLAKASRSKMLERMVEAGWLERYVHGGFEITAAGREMAKAQIPFDLWKG